MLKLGEKQTLIMVKQVDFGVYLAEHQGDDTRVLLPKKQVPADLKLHDSCLLYTSTSRCVLSGNLSSRLLSDSW